MGRLERAVYRCIQGEARGLGCDVLALGGIADHLHVLVKVPTTRSAAEIAKQVKGASSRLISDQIDPLLGFAWQEGYGVFSVSRSHVNRIQDYVHNQASRHAENRVWPEWEETSELAQPAD